MSARLSVVPERRERGLGIVRVSKLADRAEADLLSPEIQDRSIRDHAAANGIEMVEWVEAIDESGSQERSKWWPKLDAAIERVEAGEIDVIVVWKFSRAARNMLKREIALHRVQQAGGRIDSATEPADATTPVGRLTRGMIGQVDQFYADLIGESWKSSHASRIRRGLPANGKPRFGYTYDQEQKLHVPDPVTGPMLAEAYTRFAAGETFYTLIGWLNTSGVRPSEGYGKRTHTSLWSDRTIRRMMDSGFAAGLLSIHDPDCKHRPGASCTQRIHVPGIHQRLISDNLWEEYLEQRKARQRTRTSERSTYLLTGLLHCVHALPDGGTCEGTMGGSASGGNSPTGRGRPRYVCTRRIGNLSHNGGTISTAKVEPVVMAWLRELADDLEPALAREQAVNAKRVVNLDRLDGQIEAARGKVVSATRAWFAGQVPEVAWPELRAELEGTVSALEDRRAALRAAARRPVPQVVAAAALDEWATLSIEHKRGVLRQLIRRIDVVTGRVDLVDGVWGPRVRIWKSWVDDDAV